MDFCYFCSELRGHIAVVAVFARASQDVSRFLKTGQELYSSEHLGRILRSGELSEGSA